MRTINETFTEEEFQKLHAKKGTKSWHDFIMELAKQ
jgi:predicted CopG family antitoxin